MPFYRVLVFRTGSRVQHVAARARVEAMHEIDVLLGSTRELGMMERARLWQPEFETRLVLEILRRHTAPKPDDAPPDVNTDPYRRFEEFINVVRPDILALVEELDAEHREVVSGRIDFRSHHYTSEVREPLLDEVRGLCEAHGVAHTLQIDRDDGSVLTGERAVAGRLLGPVPGIKILAEALRGSPLVDDAQTAVAYTSAPSDATRR
ncbi:MAG: hypothetical protein AAF721_12420 [Myxococcota bacterium]